MRAVRLAAVAVSLAGANLLWPQQAGATALPMSDCSSTSGVVVAVDFSHWGGPLVRSCGSTPSTGGQLISQGGLTNTRVGRYPGFVCQLGYSGFAGGTAEPAGLNCANTPAASNAWSYWTADQTASSWTLSPTGADGNDPAPGTVQAWTFGSGSPSFSPGSVRASGAAPASSPVRTPVHSTAPGRPASSAPAAYATGPATGPASRQAGGQPDAAGATPAGARSTSGHPATPARSSQSAGHRTTLGSGILLPASSSGSASPSVVDASPVASATRRTGSGTPWPLAIAGGVLLILGGGGAIAARRRTRWR